MRVEVTCFGAMRDFLPVDNDGHAATIELESKAMVADAVDALGAPRRLVHAILVNDEPSDLSRGLSEGDRLTLMPHYSGG